MASSPSYVARHRLLLVPACIFLSAGSVANTQAGGKSTPAASVSPKSGASPDSQLASKDVPTESLQRQAGKLIASEFLLSQSI